MNNMNSKSIVASKYAKAFLNVYIQQISIDNLNSIEKLIAFFDVHRKTIFFLSVPNIKRSKKEEILSQLFEKFDLNGPLRPLINILASQKRLFLINEILKYISLFYKKRKNIMMFNISISHKLDTQDLEIIEQFLSIKTGKKIMSQHSVDKNLIAGIRLQSNTLLWEYSIRQQCQTLLKAI